ncbi:hypothetical protein [Flavobacterium wongokense]|uniref:hypothetical protein n=1 Tax=Flavobacterium wongokense TaxID=2910674 RepID=UPI001F489F32|nr:hypothetical protein [Flavobacterium sp. WG47]MCF6133250.1 hypothetical protein [Flavobacterium sp. WG47]
MIKKIRTSKISKVVACYLVLMMFLELTQPMVMFALTEGPAQPEFNSFTPIGTSDIVDLASGDFNYNIPIMDVGGYPINLAYTSGVTMDQEASWVGLGWNLNIGQINRNVRGLPDDFKGDEIETENNLKPNVTVSTTAYVNPQAWGLLDNTIQIGAGLEIKYNNYTGLAANPTIGASFNLSKNVSLGVSLSSSDDMGATISPSVTMSSFLCSARKMGSTINGSLTAGISYNSRQGLQSFNLSSNLRANHGWKGADLGKTGFNIGGGSANFSFNDATFTPTKRVAFDNNQFTFSFSAGPSIFGVQAEVSLSASATIQKIKDEFKREKAYGYENTELASEFDLLDFNRENELGSISKHTNVLPVTNYTYDVLSVQSQGLNGTIRPYRGQIGYVFDSYVADESSSTTMSAEIEAGWGFHYGASIKNTSSINYTSGWKTIATPYFKEKPSGSIGYERVYYKSLGELRVDPEYNPTTPTLFSQIVSDDMPVTLKLMDNNALNKYSKKVITGYDSDLAPMASFNTSNLRRTNREKRNTAIQKITKREALDYHLDNGFVKVNPNALNHHTAGFLITDEKGNRNVFGETAYNIEKKEVTFATDASANDIDCVRGIVKYAGSENGGGNSAGADHYFNSVKTKNYAHTYLISSILSPDYQDLNGDGPSDDDSGSYTKFTYTTSGDLGYSNNYKWRVPYGHMEASYNEGLKTASKDQKGSYLYGVKEIKYIKRIETKTHVALIDLEERLDGYGTINEDGGLNTGDKTYCIKSIRLYAKRPGVTIPDDISPSSSIKPIKTAHFEYDYSLCTGIENNSGASRIVNGQETNFRGKLTLKKVYFTYKGSNMGKYVPYEFVYGHNKTYNPKNYDIWGNYKVNPRETGGCQALSSQDFPYVQQTNKTDQDETAAAWSLEEVKLPSGSKIRLTLESDDYQYVQNKKAMQMFKVLGVTDNINGTVDQSLYTGGGEAKFVVVKVDEDRLPSGITSSEILRRCTEGLANTPVYFDFLLNMTSGKYDHVVGYFEMDGPAQIKEVSGEHHIYIPMRYTSKEGGGASATANPISVAGWFFGRQNLHRQVYGLAEPGDGLPNPLTLATSLISNIDEMIHIFTGPNQRLKGFGCANNFIADKSWIRLNEPTGTKLGGGLRVKKLEMFDGWDEMLGVDHDQRYEKKYGQEYSYTLGDNESSGSSGVATYEPNMSKENPLVQPFYHGTEKLSAQTYTEKPFGACFYPSPTITYSKVRVKNITAADDDAGSGPDVRKTRSGTVITYHFTSYDFPTKTDFTDLSKSKSQVNNEPAMLPNILLGMFGLSLDVRNELTLTQGFQIETNDMNGKVKKQEVYDDKNNLISYTENRYSTKNGDLSSLNNVMSVINPDGNVAQKAIGVNYDVVNDMRYNYNYSNTSGVNGNLEIIPIFVPPPVFIWILYVPTAFFDDESHYQIFRSAVTTKVIQKSGILTEKIVYDLGSQVSTKNIAWDSQTGQVLLTQTVNEFDDSYYNLNIPAYWYHNRMGMATHNTDIRGTLSPQGGTTQLAPVPYFKVDQQAANLDTTFELGDELYITSSEGTQRVWVFGFNANKTGLLLMDSSGEYVDMCGTHLPHNYTFRLLRSGYRNNQMAPMATITSMVNPIATGKLKDFLATSANDTRIINASAIEYDDFWMPQNERSAALYPNNIPGQDPQSVTFPSRLRFNPFYQNYKGNWRAVKSLTYLTGRKSLTTAAAGNPRYNGFFSAFSPFYNLSSGKWIKNGNGWTSVSEITKFSQYGPEVENRDAMGKFSSAQYGYSYTIPFAVAKNAEYKKFGFDNFEDYPNGYPSGSHFEFETDNKDRKITSDHAHTGKNSMYVAPNSKAELKKPLFPASVRARTVNCLIRLPCPLIHQNNGTEESLCWNLAGQLGFDLIIKHINWTLADGSPMLFESTSDYKYRYGNGPIVTANAQHWNGGAETFQLCFWPSDGNGNYTFYFKLHYIGGTVQDVTVPFTVTPGSTWGDDGPYYTVTLGDITTEPDCGPPQEPVQED